MCEPRVSRFRDFLQRDGILPVTTTTTVTPVEGEYPQVNPSSISGPDAADPSGTTAEEEPTIADLSGDFEAEVETRPAETAPSPVSGGLSSSELLTPEEHKKGLKDGGRLAKAVRAFSGVRYFNY